MLSPDFCFRGRRAGLLALGFGALASLFFRAKEPIFYFNTTPSIPKGLYYVEKARALTRGEVVLFRLPAALDDFASSTAWLKPGGMLIKRVGAVAGDEVCVDREVFINGKRVGEVAATDGEGHELRRPSRCFYVPVGHFLPLGDSGRSFDGRYFGVVDVKTVIGIGSLVVQ